MTAAPDTEVADASSERKMSLSDVVLEPKPEAASGRRPSAASANSDSIVKEMAATEERAARALATSRGGVPVRA